MAEEARQFQRMCEASADGIAKTAADLGVTLTYPTELRLIEFGDRLAAYLPAAQLWIWGERGSGALKMSGAAPQRINSATHR